MGGGKAFTKHAQGFFGGKHEGRQENDKGNSGLVNDLGKETTSAGTPLGEPLGEMIGVKGRTLKNNTFLEGNLRARAGFGCRRTRRGGEGEGFDLSGLRITV